MRIVMIGQRTIPARGGGVERHVEEIGARLVARGHEVSVHRRAGHEGHDGPRISEHRGMRIIELPSIRTKHLDASLHSALAAVHASARDRADVVHFHALGPGLFTPVPRLLGDATVVQTIHGLDDQRTKWGPGARAVLGGGRWLSSRVPHGVIGVSEELATIYRSSSRPGVRVAHIPNGVVPVAPVPASHLARFGLEPGRYLLYAGRMVPEKCATTLLRSFRRLQGEWRLVLAGDSSFTDRYWTEVQELAAKDPRVVLTGWVEGPDLAALYTHAAAFVQPSRLEGLPLSLLEAASAGVPIVASDIAAHAEILGADRLGAKRFAVDDEAALLLAIEDTLRNLVVARAEAALVADAVTDAFSWDRATLLTERFYEQVLTGTTTSSPARAEVDPVDLRDERRRMRQPVPVPRVPAPATRS